MNKKQYILKRLLHSVPVLFVITLIAFFSIRLVPGDPALAVLGEKASAASVEAFYQKYGLDQNIVLQYLAYLKNLLRLDFGNSLKYSIPVTQLLGTRIVVTVLLTAVSFVFIVCISYPCSYIAGMKQNTVCDKMIRLVSQIGLSIPAFWLSLLLLQLFGVKLRLLPTSGWGETWSDHFKSLILPALTQAVASSAITIRNLRSSIIDVKDSEFVSYARSKGLRENVIKSSHIVRNSMIPSVTILSMQLVSMIGGSVVVESVFTLPGIGALLVDSIFARDYAVIQTTILFYGAEVLFVFLVTDILYTLIDPRIRLD